MQEILINNDVIVDVALKLFADGNDDFFLREQQLLLVHQRRLLSLLLSIHGVDGVVVALEVGLEQLTELVGLRLRDHCFGGNINNILGLGSVQCR